MRSFTLRLQDARHTEDITDITSFVGEDSSGSFGILAGHATLMTCLIIGLARFRPGTGNWKYLALPGAILYFRNDVLTLSTRHYLIDDDFKRISQSLQQQLLAEEEKLHTIKESLHHMEEAVLKRLWALGRKETG